jgi:hypothetical protein
MSGLLARLTVHDTAGMSAGRRSRRAFTFPRLAVARSRTAAACSPRCTVRSTASPAWLLTSNLPDGVNPHIVILGSSKESECCYPQDFT